MERGEIEVGDLPHWGAKTGRTVAMDSNSYAVEDRRMDLGPASDRARWAAQNIPGVGLGNLASKGFEA